MFEKMLRELKALEGTTVSIPVPVDHEGYVDKECPSESCMVQFKIHAEDWGNIVRDEEVFCPFCRHAAPAKSWFTTEQVEEVHRRGIEFVRQKLGRAMDEDAAAWNSRQARNSFLKITMSVKSAPSPVLLPMAAADPMRQKATCTQCRCRYSYIGSAFFCPACGHNSAEETFKQSLNAIRIAVGSYSILASAMDRDAAEITIRLLREKGMNDTVMAFQRLAERLYDRIPGAPAPPRNVFQRLDEGSALWAAAKQTTYADILTTAELNRLKVLFQQRHLLSHREGIVDPDYISKSRDNSYQLGQRIVITEAAVTEFVAIAEKLGTGLMSRF